MPINEDLDRASELFQPQADVCARRVRYNLSSLGLIQYSFPQTWYGFQVLFVCLEFFPRILESNCINFIPLNIR